MKTPALVTVAVQVPHTWNGRMYDVGDRYEVDTAKPVEASCLETVLAMRWAVVEAPILRKAPPPPPPAPPAPAVDTKKTAPPDEKPAPPRK